MNKREMRVILQEAARAMPGSTVHEVEGVSNSVRVKTPFVGLDGEFLYFYVFKRAQNNRFSMMLPTESIGILPVITTMAILQKILRTYGLLLSQEAAIIEENVALPLHKRMAIISQALVGIDGIRRLWKVEFDRRTNASESETSGQSSKPADSSSSR